MKIKINTKQKSLNIESNHTGNSCEFDPRLSTLETILKSKGGSTKKKETNKELE